MPGRREHVPAVGAGGHHRAAQTRRPGGAHVRDRALVRLARPRSRILRSTSSFLRLPSPFTVSASGGSSGAPSGSRIPREARKVRIPSARGRPST